MRMLLLFIFSALVVWISGSAYRHYFPVLTPNQRAQERIEAAIQRMVSEHEDKKRQYERH